MNRDGLSHTSQLHLGGAARVNLENGCPLGFTRAAELFEYQCQENNLSPESMVGDTLTNAVVP
jgi:hypothetical protein